MLAYTTGTVAIAPANIAAASSLRPSVVLVTTKMPDGEPLRVEQHDGQTVVLWDYRYVGVEAMIAALETAPTVPAAEADAALAADEARITFPDWFIGAELFRNPDDPQAAPVVTMWAQGMAGDPAGDTELDAAGVDRILGDLDQFAAQLRALRLQLATETPEGAR